MDKIEKFCVADSSTIKESISIIQKDLCRCVVVLNQHKKVAGVFSEGDVLRTVLEGIDMYTPLKKVIKPSFYFLNTKDIRRAFDLVKKYGITLIPVITNDFELKDVLTIFDIIDKLELRSE